MRDITHDRFVAHLDILGMSAMVEKDAEEAWRVLTDLVAVRDQVTNVTLEFVDRAERINVAQQIRTVTFSDTIVLYTHGAKDTDLRALVIVATELFYKALYHAVPVRVGIALGTFFFNWEKDMYAGPALIDAYRTGESAQWLGVRFSPSVGGREALLGLTSGARQLVVEWDVPTSSGVERSNVVNWPASAEHNLKLRPPFTAEQFFQIFEGRFGPFAGLDPRAVVKYANTVEFMNRQLLGHGA